MRGGHPEEAFASANPRPARGGRRLAARDQSGRVVVDAGRRQDVARAFREDQSDGVVEQAGRVGSGDKHQESEPGEFEARRLGRRDALARRKDDVRSETKGDGLADKRRAKETRRAQEFHEGSSRNGLFQMQVQLDQPQDNESPLFELKSFIYSHNLSFVFLFFSFLAIINCDFSYLFIQ